MFTVVNKPSHAKKSTLRAIALGVVFAASASAVFGAGLQRGARPQAPRHQSSAPTVDENKETGGYGPAQDAADVLRDFTGSDGAFFAAGLIKDGFKKGEDLTSLLLYPQDEVMVLKLTGAQLKAAFERSVSLYPQPNTSFLQLSGFDVTFNKSAASGSRVTSARAGGAPLEPTRVYTVSMPSSLGRGGLGFFKIWDTPNIAKTYSQTVESVLKGKQSSGSSPRWSVSG